MTTPPWISHAIANAIAIYLRLAAETVSRILRRFQNDGIVRVERRDVEILDRSRLEEIARNVL